MVFHSLDFDLILLDYFFATLSRSDFLIFCSNSRHFDYHTCSFSPSCFSCSFCPFSFSSLSHQMSYCLMNLIDAFYVFCSFSFLTHYLISWMNLNLKCKIYLSSVLDSMMIYFHEAFLSPSKLSEQAIQQEFSFHWTFLYRR